MAYEFEVTKWEDWDGVIHDGTPDDSDLPEVCGLLTHHFDKDTGDDGYKWTYVEPPADDEYWDWDDWYELIEGLYEADYGMEMAS